MTLSKCLVTLGHFSQPAIVQAPLWCKSLGLFCFLAFQTVRQCKNTLAVSSCLIYDFRFRLVVNEKIACKIMLILCALVTVRSRNRYFCKYLQIWSVGNSTFLPNICMCRLSLRIRRCHSLQIVISTNFLYAFRWNTEISQWNRNW